MFIYFLFLILIIFFELFLVHQEKKGKQISICFFGKNIDLETFFLLICFSLLFILLVFRDYTVGTDLKNYLIRFIKIGETPFNELYDISNYYSFEFGFTLLNKIIYMIFPSTFSFMILSSLISLFGFYHFINKYSRNKLFSFYIFFTFSMATNSMNTIRQYMAISILLYSLDYLLNKDIKKYLLYIFLATSIHSSSIIFIVLYPLINRFKVNVINKKYVFLLLLFIAFFLFGGFELIKYLMSFTSFAWYLNNLNGSGETMLILLFSMYIYLLFAFINKETDQIINLSMIMLGITILLNAVAIHIGIIERLMRSFIPSIIVLIPNSIDCIDLRKHLISLGKIALHFCFALYFIYIMSSPASSGNTNLYKIENPIKLNNEIRQIYDESYSNDLIRINR